MDTKSDIKLLEQCHSNCEKYDCNKDVKLEDSVIDYGDFVIPKSEVPLSDNNLAQGTPFESIKVEDAGNSNSYELKLEKIEIIKVETCIKQEEDFVSQKDPLSEDYKTHRKVEINGELNPQNNHSHLAGKKSNDAGNTSFTSAICGKNFLLQSMLNLHNVSHSNSRPYQCNICEKRFKTRKVLRFHQDVHSENRPFHCNQCNKTFKRRYNLKAHQLMHSKLKQCICEICGKGYVNLTGLKYHKASHEIKNDIACPQCGKLVQGKERLKHHVRHVHSVKMVHICSYCGKTFNKKKGMMNHINKHINSKPLSCEICNKSVKRASSLRSHMRTHTGETPYHCKLCASAFKFSYQLWRHMKVHIKKE